jgi:phage major head subunit gpT-like protein
MYNSAIAVLKGIRSEFAKQLGDYTAPLFAPFVSRVKSDSNNEDYRYRDTIGTIREWKTRRVTEDFKDYKYQIVNKPFEFTLDVDRFTLDDSKKTLGGAIEQEIRQAAQLWKGFEDEQVYELITDNGTAYDGSTFFATSHNIDGDNAIDNLKTGTQTGTYTLAQIEADLATARTAMYGYRDNKDRPINTNPRWIVLIPSQLHDKFLTLRNSQDVYISGTKTNIYQNSFEIVLNHWQSTSDYDWYLINANATILPFTVQERMKMRWDVKDDMENRYIKYMSTARYGFGYSAFTSICKINN